MSVELLHPDIVGQCYNDVLDIIRQTVRRFVNRYGGNYDDLFADASMAFMKGHRAYCEGRANSTDYELEIKRWVWYELFDAYRVRSQHRRKQKVVIHNEEYCEQILEQRRGDFSLVEFFDELSEDARVAAGLVLDTPSALCAAARARGGTDRNLRCLIRQELAGRGWGAARIADAFEEIRVALK